MRFGLLLLGEYLPERLKKLAQVAEAHDFEHLWVADEKFFRDPYASLAYLSQHTSRIHLGPCVTDPFTRHPAITAMAMATLDEIAGGRVFSGLGPGSAAWRRWASSARRLSWHCGKPSSSSASYGRAERLTMKVRQFPFTPAS